MESEGYAMAPTLDVEIQDLVALTQTLSEVGNTFVGTERLVADTHIALLNWPQGGHQAAGAYEKAVSTVEDAAGAVRDASDSTARNLDAVAVHYADAEYHSSITPGTEPASRRANSGSSVTAENVGHMAFPIVELAGAGALLLAARRAQQSFRSAAGPELLAFFLLVDSIVITPNIRASGPFREARDTWHAITDANIQPALDRLTKLLPIQSWDGDAATAFNAHMRNHYLPALEQLRSLAKSMGDLCDQLAGAVDLINKWWVVIFLATIGALVAANLLPPPYRLILKFSALVTLFLPNVYLITQKMEKLFSAKTEAIQAVEKQATELAAECFDNAQTLEANRNLLNPHFTMVADNWSSEDWTRNWHHKPNT